MLNNVYNWAVTLSNLFLVVLISWVGFRPMPEQVPRRRWDLLRTGIVIILLGELLVIVKTVLSGPLRLEGNLFLQVGSGASLLISAVVLQAMAGSWIRRPRRRRRGPDDFGGNNSSGVTAPLGPSPLVLADAKPCPQDR